MVSQLQGDWDWLQEPDYRHTRYETRYETNSRPLSDPMNTISLLFDANERHVCSLSKLGCVCVHLFLHTKSDDQWIICMWTSLWMSLWTSIQLVLATTLNQAASELNSNGTVSPIWQRHNLMTTMRPCVIAILHRSLRWTESPFRWPSHQKVSS